MRLISNDTSREIHIGDTVVDFRGDPVIVTGFTAPHKAGSTGRVTLMEDGREGSYFPGVINARIEA